MSDLSRRAFARALFAAPAAAALSPAIGRAEATADAKTPPPLATLSIGRFQVTALTDGYADIPFGFFTGRDAAALKSDAEKLYSARGDGVRLSFNQLLVRDGDRLILIDAGPAGGIGQTGALPAALASIGVQPNDVDAVILTHLHFDHISGLVAGGRKVFANAEIYADRRDVRYWGDETRAAGAPDILSSSFAATAELLRLYPGLNAIDGEREIVPGLSIVDLTGHTPGHIGVRVADGDESLIMTSDMLFHPAAHPADAAIGFVFEQDPAAARAMREAFFPRAADEGALIAATHMPFPGLGRVVEENGERRWLKADWAHG